MLFSNGLSSLSFISIIFQSDLRCSRPGVFLNNVFESLLMSVSQRPVGLHNLNGLKGFMMDIKLIAFNERRLVRNHLLMQLIKLTGVTKAIRTRSKPEQASLHLS